MKFFPHWLFLALALMPRDVAADQDQCGDRSTIRPSYVFDGQSCQCGSALSNLTVAAPRGMRLKAACELIATESGGSRPVDLQKGKVSLDKFSASGGYFDGTLLFSGTIVVDGVVKVVPSPAGDIFFFPEPSLAPYKSVFARQSYGVLLKLTEVQGEQFTIPKENNCWRATAKIRMRGIEVELSESDSRGAYPVGLEVLSHSRFTKIHCELDDS